MTTFGKFKPVGEFLTAVEKIKQEIEAIENGSHRPSRSAANTRKRLELLKKQLKEYEDGTVPVTGTYYPGETSGGFGSTSTATETGITAGLKENVLHQFASYTALFTLSGINEQELQSWSFLNDTVHDVIARSSGIGADINQSGSGRFTSGNPNVDNTEQAVNEFTSFQNALGVLKKGRDIFIEEVNILSTVGPSEERGMGDFSKMTFKLHEPYGISFIEKMRAVARINGYKDHLDSPVLLTIEFKGFDENGIEMKGRGTLRKIPVLITRAELDVNEGGAIYDVTAVRINDIAFDDRFKFPRSEITIEASGLEQAADSLAEQLNKQILTERDEHKVREVLDEYRILVDERVEKLSRGFIDGKNVRNVKKPSRPGGNPNAGQKIKIEATAPQIAGLVSLTKFLEDMVRGTIGYEDLASDFWTAYLRRTGQITGRDEATEEEIKNFILSENFEDVVMKNSYVDWFKIKTSVKTDYSKFDNINKMHRKIITYRIIPYKIHVLKFMRPGIFLSKGVARNAVKKQYNYLYTGANTDIQSLRINYKTAFFMRNTIEVKKGTSNGAFEKIETIISKIIGKEDVDDGDTTTLRQYPSVVHGKNTFNTSEDGKDTDTGKLSRAQDFYDYLTNPVADMMRIELEILGDPAYICQDQFIPLNKQDKARREGEIYDEISGSFNADTHSPLIELIYRLPDDVNDRTGVMFESKSTAPEENLFFAGVYQVSRIESKFSNGQFTQTLDCNRLNNQSGAGEPLFDIVKVAAGKTLKAANSKNIKTNKVPAYHIDDKGKVNFFPEDMKDSLIYKNSQKIRDEGG